MSLSTFNFNLIGSILCIQEQFSPATRPSTPRLLSSTSWHNLFRKVFSISSPFQPFSHLFPIRLSDLYHTSHSSSSFPTTLFHNTASNPHSMLLNHLPQQYCFQTLHSFPFDTSGSGTQRNLKDRRRLQAWLSPLHIIHSVSFLARHILLWFPPSEVACRVAAMTCKRTAQHQHKKIYSA